MLVPESDMELDSDATMGLGMGMGDLGEPPVMLVWMLANAVNHANPVVITFPVVHKKPTWCYQLKCPKWTLATGRTAKASIDDANKMRNLHALFQAVDPHLRMVLKNRNSLWYIRDDRLVVLEVWIFAYCFQSHFFIRCIASYWNWISIDYYEIKRLYLFMPFFSVTSYYCFCFIYKTWTASLFVCYAYLYVIYASRYWPLYLLPVACLFSSFGIYVVRMSVLLTFSFSLFPFLFTLITVSFFSFLFI